MPEVRKRLKQYLAANKLPDSVEQLTPDASTREYFRIKYQGGTAIACVYPEQFKADEQSFLDVTRLFCDNGLPVARVLDFSEELGVIVQEDLGNTVLRDVLESSNSFEREELIERAIGMVAKIQKATDSAFATNSIASKLKFDTEKLLWELDFFREHYFETLRHQPLPQHENDALRSEFVDLSRDLESRAAVLCHRDFHAANLMIDQNGELRIIDHQDARIGSVSYDLVSLLLDRVTSPPHAYWLAAKRRSFLSEREKNGLTPISENEVAEEFRLQTIQRCLKAVGTFSFQSVNRGKSYFIPFIQPMFGIVWRAAENLDRFPVLNEVIKRELETDHTRK